MFWCEQTGYDELRLRRYRPDPTEADHCNAKPPTVHNDVTYWQNCAAVSAPVYEVVPARFMPADGDTRGRFRDGDAWKVDEFAGHPLWPTSCDACGMPVDDRWVDQVWTDQWYKADGVGQWTHRHLPAGAMFDAWWLPDSWRGSDGIALTVMVPSGYGRPVDWHVDSQASNCTRPGEPHSCWCRRGNPRRSECHVDKNCNSCSAGAGSIQVPGWHGFCRENHLVE